MSDSSNSANPLLSAQQATSQIVQGSWVLTELDGQELSLAPDQKQPMLTFSESGQVTGYVGCNPLTGGYEIMDGQRVKFSQLGVGLSSCPNADTEGQFLSALNTADNFMLIGDKLSLTVGRRAPMAVLSRRTEDGITNKYWKLVRLEGRNVVMAEGQQREQYFTLRSDGTIIGFAGCNSFNGSYTHEAGKKRIRVGDDLASTRMACPPGVDDNSFLEVLKTADNYTSSANELSLNIGRRAPLAVFEAIYF